MKFIIVDHVHPVLFELFDAEGIEYDYVPEIQQDILSGIISNYQGLIVRNKRIDKQLIQKAKRLQYIGRAGAGLDNIDIVQAFAQNIHVVNAAEANRDTLGEHTLGMLLCLLNKINISHARLRTSLWDREGGRGIELNGKTVSIIGYGNMGTAFAQRLKGFDCKVLYFDRKEKNNPFEFVQKADLETVFKESDIVSLHIPLDAHNNRWVNETFINSFTKNIYLINVARGEVVESNALVQALKNGKILGACIDVFENEKLETFTEEQRANFDYLVQQDHVVFTPHVAGWSVESYEKISRVLFQKLIKHLKNA
ncbi:MAG TPA: NAD(P)-dependent oxidoreductase [Cytophagales bacterium]|nr:NAD(P)-dependent oxidoreductase [Cytophagales bacterium]